MIVSIAGRRHATARILLDAALGDFPHEFTADPASADVAVFLDATAQTRAVLSGAIVVAYADDSATVEATRQLGARVVTFGLSSSADVRAEAVGATVDGTSFVVASGDAREHASVGIVGESVVPLVLAALTVAAAAGVPTVDAIANVRTITAGAAHDMRVTRPVDGLLLVDDTLDLSPQATADALKALAQFTVDGTRSVAVLGELELPVGTDLVDSRDHHDRIGRLVVRLNVSRLIVVGQAARHIHNAAGLEGSWDGESVLVDTADEAYDLLNATEFSAPDAAPLVVLVKAATAAGITDRLALINQPRRAT